MAATGEKRKTDQPFHVDRLPVSVQMVICRLKSNDGLSWQQIEDLSRLPKGVDGGFVDWVNLPANVLEYFPGRYIPHSNMHRWFDVRKRQVIRETEQKSAQAREIAEAFAASVIEKGDEAVLYAARDTIMTVLAEDSTADGRAKAAKALISLAEVMQSARANDIKERQVAVSERKLAALEAEAERKRKVMDEETERMSKKASKGQIGPEDIDRLRERVFGLPPKAQKAE
jgi:hypothetical protein